MPEVDKILEPYAEKSYNKYFNEYLEICEDVNGIIPEVLEKWYSERKMMQAAMNNYQHLVKDGMDIPSDMLDSLTKDM